MDQIGQAWNWFLGQSLVVQALVLVGILNILVAGLRAMGWTYLADECLKIENAIKAMVDAGKSSISSLTQKKGS